MSPPLSIDEISRSDRWHAVECNNLARSLVETVGRTPAQDAEMLHAVHATLGDGKHAHNYAQQSAGYLLLHSPPDEEAAWCDAVLAHAACAAGNSEPPRTEYRLAEERSQAIVDPEDRAIFQQSFAVIPRPGRQAS